MAPSPASPLAQDSDAGDQDLPEPAPAPAQAPPPQEPFKVLAAIANTANNASSVCKLTREFNEATEDQKQIHKAKLQNAARLKKVRQKKYRLLKRMDGLDEEGMAIMQDLFKEVQAKRIAKTSPSSSSGCKKTPKAKVKK